NAARTPGIELERHVHPARHRGHIAHRAWSKVLVALGGAVASGMRDADEGDVAAAWIAIERAAKQRGDVPPIQSLDHHLVAGGKLYRGHGAAPPGVVRKLSHMARRRALEKRTERGPTRWSAGARFVVRGCCARRAAAGKLVCDETRRFQTARPWCGP